MLHFLGISRGIAAHLNLLVPFSEHWVLYYAAARGPSLRHELTIANHCLLYLLRVAESPEWPILPDCSCHLVSLFAPPSLVISCLTGKLHTIFALIAPILSPKSLQFLPQNN